VTSAGGQRTAAGAVRNRHDIAWLPTPGLGYFVAGCVRDTVGSDFVYWTISMHTLKKPRLMRGCSA